MANSKPNKPTEAKPEAAPAASTSDKYNKRRWTLPSKRAAGYANDRKAKVHTYGPKEGKPLTDFEAGIRSGYLQCQSDHTGIFRLKEAFEHGLPKEKAIEYSRQKGTKIEDFIKKGAA